MIGCAVGVHVYVLCAYANDTNLIWHNFAIVFISIYRPIDGAFVCVNKRESAGAAAGLGPGSCVCAYRGRTMML